MKRFIVGVVIVALLLVAANDLWRYVESQRRLRDTTYTVSRWAAENAQTMSRDQAAASIASMAAASGVTVTMYGQTDDGVQVWTQTEVPGTIVAATVANLLVGKGLSQAVAEPFTIRDYRRAGIK